MLKGKKADATMIILIIIIIFFLAVSFLVVNFVGIRLQTILTDTVMNETEEVLTIAGGMDTVITKTIDNGFMFIFAFLIIGIIISSFLIKIHPVWLFLYIIFLALGIFLAIFLGNTYQKLTEVSVLAEAVSNMPKALWVMKHSLKIVLGFGALSMVVIFSKIFGGGGGIERI